MQGYSDSDKVIKELSSTGKYLLQNFYTGSFTKDSSEFRHLLEELKHIWGIQPNDLSEDVMIIEYLNQKKEIKQLKEDYLNYQLVNVLVLANTLDTYNLKDEDCINHISENQSYEIGKMMYNYILQNKSNNYIFKILKERYIDYLHYTNERQERVYCYIFKINKNEDFAFRRSF